MRENNAIVEWMCNVTEEDRILHTDHLYDGLFCDVLKAELDCLSEDGRLFIPIFNKMGMKYWAGCQHEGGYAFTKQELIDMLETLEIRDYTFLYPYPDHVHPMAIYSDAYLPQKGELTLESYNFEKERLVLFHEAKAYDMIIHEKLFSQFSNSFLLVIGSGKKEESTIFTKFSYERDERFAIKTDIIRTKENQILVKKSALYPEGKLHIDHMYACYKGLSNHMQDTNWNVVSCEKEHVALVFPYIYGETLANKLYVLVNEENKEALFQELKSYIANIKAMFGTDEFHMSEEFVKVFGKTEFPVGKNYTTSDYNNIDLLLDNILVDGEKHYVIDYEWTFDFPVPLEYAIYRILHYFILRSEKIEWLENQNLYAAFGISEEEISVFEQMERNFQRYIEGTHKPMRDIYEEEGAGRLDIGALVYAYKKQVQCNQGRVYFDYGQGFTEEHVVPYQAKLEDGICKLKMEIPEGIHAFRIDPVEDYGCLLQVEKLVDENGHSLLKEIASNGKRSGEDVFLFATKDPWIKCKKSMKKIYFEYRISVCDDELLKKYDKTANIRKVYNKIFK